MEQLLDTKVSKIVAQNYKTAQVFSQYGIDFCCNGGIPLRDACDLKDVDQQAVVEQIETVLMSRPEMDYNSLSMQSLIGLIQDTHHEFVRTMTPILQQYLEKLCRVHGGNHPELHAIRAEFEASATELAAHMMKEELVLFPYVVKMEQALKTGAALPDSQFGSVENPIKAMEAEHEQEGDRFRRIAELTNNYTAPKDGCQTYKVAFANLRDFEEDLHKHVHLENNILFPKAIALFKQMQTPAPQCQI